MKNRRRAREIALQTLYEAEMRGVSSRKILETTLSRYRFKPEVKEFAEKLALGTSQYLSPIDFLIKKYAKNWSLERIAIVDRNILRFAIYELLLLEEVPPIVSINEGVEIAKRYGTADSGRFINGILDKIRKERGPSSSLEWNHLKNILQSNPYLNDLIRSKNKEKLHLVGGCIRDLLLGKEPGDLDLITEDSQFSAARKFAHQQEKDLIELDPQLRRLYLPEGEVIDFTLRKSRDLRGDLFRRDFTINALALDLDFIKEAPLFLVDPDTGLEDLINRKIRLLRKNSFDNDPLRILRVFRLRAELKFEIEEDVLALIRSKYRLINKVARERIKEELFLILRDPESYKYLQDPSAVLLLKDILGQGPHLDSLRRLEILLSQEEAMAKELKGKLTLHLKERNQEAIARGELLKLAALTFSPRERKVHLSSLGQGLKLSVRKVKILERMEKLYPRLEKVIAKWKDPYSVAEFLILAKKEIVEVCLLFLVLNPEEASRSCTFELLKEYFHKADLILHPPRLIGGEELMRELAIGPGPHLSSLLEKIHQAQLVGEVRSRSEALEYAREVLPTLELTKKA
jgi:transcription antitermination factor NusB